MNVLRRLVGTKVVIELPATALVKPVKLPVPAHAIHIEWSSGPVKAQLGFAVTLGKFRVE